MANDGVRVGTYVVVGAYVAKVGAGVGGMKTVGAKVLGEGLGEGDLLGERVGVEDPITVIWVCSTQTSNPRSLKPQNGFRGFGFRGLGV